MPMCRQVLQVERVVVVEDINPDGRIHYFSEIWGATTKGKKFSQSEQVKIIGMDVLNL